jgi:hypothetical protein
MRWARAERRLIEIMPSIRKRWSITRGVFMEIREG